MSRDVEVKDATRARVKAAAKIEAEPMHLTKETPGKSAKPDGRKKSNKVEPANPAKPRKRRKPVIEGPSSAPIGPKRKYANNRDKTIAQPTDKKLKDIITINLVDTPIWRHIIETAVQEYAKRYFRSNNRIMNQSTTAKSLLEPAIQYVETQKLTGDQLMAECDSVFAYDPFKKGALQVSRDFLDKRITPLQMKLLATYTGDNTTSWSIRSTVLMVMFVYANFLVKNYNKDTNFMV